MATPSQATISRSQSRKVLGNDRGSVDEKEKESRKTTIFRESDAREKEVDNEGSRQKRQQERMSRSQSRRTVESSSSDKKKELKKVEKEEWIV